MFWSGGYQRTFHQQATIHPRDDLIPPPARGERSKCTRQAVKATKHGCGSSCFSWVVWVSTRGPQPLSCEGHATVPFSGGGPGSVVEIDFVPVDFIRIRLVYTQSGQTGKKNQNTSLVLFRGPDQMWRRTGYGPRAVDWRPLVYTYLHLQLHTQAMCVLMRPHGNC